MDQVKVILGYLGKYHFWLLCLVVVIASTLGWMMAKGAISKEYETNKSAVTGKFSTLDGILTGDPPPNAEWTEAITTLTKQEQDKVAAAWKTVYDEQQKVLKWPVEAMDADFEKWIAVNKPGTEIPFRWRLLYQNNVIQREFPRLIEIAQALPPELEDKPTTTITGDYKIIWEDENQNKIRTALDMLGETPSSQAIWLKQEDLWVYAALLNIIRATNEGSGLTSRVKILEKMAIGSDAAELFAAGMESGKVKRLAETPDAGAGGGFEAPPGPVETEMPGMGPKPDANRYVGADGKPLPAEPVGEQFKRLPVYMKLVMDQRAITRLLTECANYPLPVEVQQFRVNPQAKEGSTSGGSTAPPPGQTQRGPVATSPDVYDVTVELCGIIYIYNPPDAQKLGDPAAGGQLAGAQ